MQHAPTQAVTIPWPPKELNPNARVHRMVLAKHKKAYRANCGWYALTQGVKAATSDALHLVITFHPPDKRRRDLDNMLASIKSGLDGLRDILGVDDSNWSLTIRKANAVGGFIRVEVGPQNTITPPLQ